MGLLGKLLSVGAAMGVSPAIILPVQEKIAPVEMEIRPGTSWVCDDPVCGVCRWTERQPTFTLAS